ncbi:acetyl-CoA acyltransferase [Amycolatopsis mediterranei S699]|uniref:Acetyl-CoA acyltransferase n=2 Tax=Amycolatopsis mediterranei TaxID=33910 RepID=A0A0H3D8I3_AMYMU|nr:thiolase family protein [Amycolatopsis mediterranei]ADJ46383.1 acetyl-CoA acyltransferase [Amycolatopsis mediterranei U32]AEK43177.1 acetyl-CoA acyltransferase [Amycolatopsis mediterranei S699]AFO78094.1 acetyl-CoA acyltransferase [Amycolatopsis mediterranei S699]AGT85222.1 acetyl-CoA acyltransferase [Amycolatopsis mediterranei RB]KDO06378.1 acetyl-CoA acetyltransferase [Amycolatopsis mediterranei]
MTDAVIVDAVRTPIGKGKPSGTLAGVHPVDLHAHALRSLVERTGVDPVRIDDVISGAVGQIGEQSMNTARWAALAAGLPESVPAVTVDRQCGSSQQAIHFAAQGVIAGAYDVVIASGVESMSRVPMGSQVAGRDPFGPQIAARYPDGLVPQGISAELIAAKWGFTRAQLDEFSAESHQRAAKAWADGKFAGEVAPLKAPGPDGTLREITTDETVRPGTTSEILAGLKPAFRADVWEQRFPDLGWHVTAGNSSPINDGAAALLITSAETAKALGLKPRARIHSFAVAGDDPLFMLTGIIPATRKVLARAGLEVSDIDAFEVNEAFASVVLAWQREIGADPARTNINGGAIALGHPLGGSGARLATTLLSVLEQTGGRYGLQTMCEAGGLANATIIERLN